VFFVNSEQNQTLKWKYMVPTTLQKSFSLTFEKKWIVFSD